VEAEQASLAAQEQAKAARKAAKKLARQQAEKAVREQEIAAREAVLRICIRVVSLLIVLKVDKILKNRTSIDIWKKEKRFFEENGGWSLLVQFGNP
jgi:hypothetical protein